MAVLEQLEPKAVFHFFEEICGIPHGSGNTAAISDYLVRFAGERNLEHYRDAAGNVIIIKEASEGREDSQPLMIQGHMDMVAVKESGCDIDLKTEGLRLAVRGDQIYAEGTSLGGDDGIAVAYALAILDSDAVSHPRLEVVITTEEEVGMDGARAIDLSVCCAKRLLNLDSEEEGYLLAGCAGGATFQAVYPIRFHQYPGTSYKLLVTGLQGGHSGSEIHKELGNANLILARVVSRLMKRGGIHLISLDGGKKDNVIPDTARAELLIEEAAYDKAAEELERVKKEIYSELKLRDPKVCIMLESSRSANNRNGCESDGLKNATASERKKEEYAAGDVHAVEDASAEKLLEMIQVMPRGVCGMSPAVSGLVETSLNLGDLTMTEREVHLGYLVRSSVASKKEELLERMKMVCGAYHASWQLKGDYPGWEYRTDSPLRDAVCKVYREMYGKDMIVQAIHAGLECGFFDEKIEGLDCVSLGPDMSGVHTPRETLSISSTERVYQFLIRLLEVL